MFDLNEPIVIDNGSNRIRYNFACNDVAHEFDCIIGNDLVGCMHQIPKYVDYAYIGNVKRSNFNIFNIRNPIKHGKIDQWCDMIKIWQFIFKELHADTMSHPLLMSNISPYTDKCKLTEVVFDCLGVPALSLISQSVLSLLSSGLLTGIDINSGYYSTSVVPICDGCELANTRNTLPIGGKDLSEYLSSILNLRGYSYDFFVARNRLKIDDIKEKYCFVSLDYDKKLKESFNAQYTLPDGRKFRPGIESFMVPEALFRPHPVCLESNGIVDLLKMSLEACDVTLKSQLSSNVILSGGSTLFRGFADRINKDMDVSYGVSVYSPPERQQSAWMGGSILASCKSIMRQKWITKEEYDEYGSSIALRKFV